MYHAVQRNTFHKGHYLRLLPFPAPYALEIGSLSNSPLNYDTWDYKFLLR